MFKDAERDLHFNAEVYRLGDRFEGLPGKLAYIYLLDTTKIPGCHYGANNVFVRIIRHLEEYGLSGSSGHERVSPEKSILVEPSTGNGWVAFSDAASYLGYEHVVVMPDGLPEARYRHPLGKAVKIIKTPIEDYALGMPRKMKELVVFDNPERMRAGEKLYVSPNHAVSASDITVEAMSDLDRQLLDRLSTSLPIRVVISMGNGSSLVSIGEYIKRHSPGAKVTATESLNFGGGFDRFARVMGFPGYKDLFGIDPGCPELMSIFSAFGTNAPIGIELPLQTRAIEGGLIDDYCLFTDDRTSKSALEMNLAPDNIVDLPNYDNLPKVLWEKYGNSTLANIAVAGRFADKEECVVAMAYDGRENY